MRMRPSCSIVSSLNGLVGLGIMQAFGNQHQWGRMEIPVSVKNIFGQPSYVLRRPANVFRAKNIGDKVSAAPRNVR